MSIASEITRLQNAKSSIKTSIENKGVTVPSATTLDGYSTLIDSIPVPSGTITISEPGTYNVTNYASAEVDYTKYISYTWSINVDQSGTKTYTTTIDCTNASTYSNYYGPCIDALVASGSLTSSVAVYSLSGSRDTTNNTFTITIKAAHNGTASVSGRVFFYKN